MNTSNLRWIRAVPGCAEGAPGQREASYKTPLLSRSRVEVLLHYRVGGFWIHPDNADPGYQLACLPKGRLSQRPGAPSVPTDVFSLALPEGADFDPGDLQAHVDRTKVVRGRYRLAPAAEPTVEGEIARREEDPEIYGSDAWYPETVARCTPPSEVDGLLRTVVTLYPLAFAPRSGRLLLRTHISLRLPCRIAARASRSRRLVDWGSPLVRATVGYEQLLPR